MKRVILTLAFGALVAVSCSKKEEPVKESNVMLPEPTEQTAATAAATPEEEGKALIAGSDCLTCHKEDAKLVGPSYQEVAAKYTEADIDMLADKSLTVVAEFGEKFLCLLTLEWIKKMLKKW